MHFTFSQFVNAVLNEWPISDVTINNAPVNSVWVFAELPISDTQIGLCSVNGTNDFVILMYTALDLTCLYSFEFCEPGLAGSPSTLRLQLFQICTPSWDYRGLFTLFLMLSQELWQFLSYLIELWGNMFGCNSLPLLYVAKWVSCCSF